MRLEFLKLIVAINLNVFSEIIKRNGLIKEVILSLNPFQLFYAITVDSTATYTPR